MFSFFFKFIKKIDHTLHVKKTKNNKIKKNYKLFQIYK
jgi:hypothetical protein